MDWLLLPFDISKVIEKEFYEADSYFVGTDIKLTLKKDKPIISMVMRDPFDQLIVQKAQDKGITLLQNHKVIAIEFGEYQIIHTTQGNITTKFIIAADDALSRITKITGWKETRTLIPALEYEIKIPKADFDRLSQNVRFDVNALPNGYALCFPKKKNHLSVGVCVFSKKNEKINLKKHYTEYIK